MGPLPGYKSTYRGEITPGIPNYKAIYKGPITPFITIVGAHLVGPRFFFSLLRRARLVKGAGTLGIRTPNQKIVI